MYRLGLSRKRIAELVRVAPAAVGYHLVIARRQDPGLETEHHTAAGAAPVPYPSPKALPAWRRSPPGSQPRTGSPIPAPNEDERSMARWFTERRREAVQGALDPAYRNGLAQVPG